MEKHIARNYEETVPFHRISTPVKLRYYGIFRGGYGLKRAMISLEISRAKLKQGSEF